MRKKKIGDILKEVLKDVKPEDKEIKEIENYVKEFLKKFNSQAKKLKINAEGFVGGSFAKGTVIKKDHYDIDIFVRFDKKYRDDEISNLTEKILKTFRKDFDRIHGSRDYFKVEGTKVPFTKSSFKLGGKSDNPINFYIEIIPVIKIKNPKEARNITDLSYSHVRYLNKKTNKKLLDEIRLVKAFCYANKCYGAESYINGFSGYSLELLTHYYGGFMNLLKAIAKTKDKIFIDIEKNYRNKNVISMDLNSSKLQSPIVLIDPTFKQRNAAAALSQEAFDKLKKASKKFIKNPSRKAFVKEEFDIEKIKSNAKKNKLDFVLLKIETDRQEGDIAGSKLLKFYRHLKEEVKNYFVIKTNVFEYDNKKQGEGIFVGKNKKELIIEGPPLIKKENVEGFKKAHKNVFVKKDKLYAKEKINFNLKEFFVKWKKKNIGKMKAMSIVSFEILD